MGKSHPDLNAKKYYPFIKLVCGFCVMLGFVVMAGWILNIRILISLGPGFPPMKFNSAVGFVLLGTALYLRLRHERLSMILSKFLAVVVMLLGTFSVLQNLFGYDFGIDQLFVSGLNEMESNTRYPGRMSAITALCFIFMGKFFFGACSGRAQRIVVQLFLHLVTLISFLAIIGYLFNVQQFYRLSSSIAIAAQSAAAFFLLSIAASLVNPTKGITGLFTGSQIGNIMIRKTFLKLTVLILLLTYLRILSNRFGLVDVEMGIILFALTFIIVSLILIGRVSTDLNAISLKKSEAEISLSRINAFLDSTPDPIFIIDIKGVILIANNQAVNIFGHSRRELIGQNIDLLMPTRLRNRQGSQLYGFHTAPVIGAVSADKELYALKKDQTEIPVEITTSPIESAAGAVENVSVAIRDISWRKQVESQLREISERNKIFIQELEAISNSGYVSMIGTDIKGIITYFNKGAEQMLQYAASEMVGIECTTLIHPEEEIQQRSRELSDLYGRNISGFDVFVEIAKHENFESREWTCVRKDGSSFPVQLVVTALRNNKNEITGFLKVAIDISETKNVQQELQAILKITTDQNSRLKNFAHIVSHNLTAHSSNLAMLLDVHISDHPELEKDEMITHLITSSDKLKETIDHLNEIVLINTSVEQQLDPVNLRTAIESATLNVSYIAKAADVEIINQVNPSFTVMGLSAYMDSILLNFITNGIKYRSLDRPATITFTAIIENQFIVLQIQDNGIGIDMHKNEAKLFGMYRTFHNNKDARGIGLFITKNQVEAMGGRIEVESAIDKGTIFKVYLKNI